MAYSLALRGRVIDPQGNPIAGASVRVYGNLRDSTDFMALDETIEVTTDTEGEFTAYSSVNTFECTLFYVDVTADGYQSIIGDGVYDVWQTESVQNHDFTYILHPE